MAFLGFAMSKRRTWIVLLKVTVTVTILSFLLFRIDLYRSLSAVQGARKELLAYAFILNFLALIVSTLKWDRLLRGLGVYKSKLDLLKLYFIGFFLSVRFFPEWLAAMWRAVT